MDYIISSVRHSPVLWFVVSLVLMLVSGAVVTYSGKCLKTTAAPYGIVSLELAWQQNTALSIRHQWSVQTCSPDDDEAAMQPTLITRANRNIVEDLFFMLCYPFFLMVCVILFDPNKIVKRLSYVLMMLAICS